MEKCVDAGERAHTHHTNTQTCILAQNTHTTCIMHIHTHTYTHDHTIHGEKYVCIHVCIYTYEYEYTDTHQGNSSRTQTHTRTLTMLFVPSHTRVSIHNVATNSVCCSVLPRVTVCGSVLQRGEVMPFFIVISLSHTHTHIHNTHPY